MSGTKPALLARLAAKLGLTLPSQKSASTAAQQLPVGADFLHNDWQEIGAGAAQSDNHPSDQEQPPLDSLDFEDILADDNDPTAPPTFVDITSGRGNKKKNSALEACVRHL